MIMTRADTNGEPNVNEKTCHHYTSNAIKFVAFDFTTPQTVGVVAAAVLGQSHVAIRTIEIVRFSKSGCKRISNVATLVDTLKLLSPDYDAVPAETITAFTQRDSNSDVHGSDKMHPI